MSRIPQINAALSRQLGLARLMDLHRAVWDQNDASAGASAPPPAIYTGQPLAMAVVKPNYRPFWANRKAARSSSGGSARRSRADLARINQGGEAELPLWQAMTNGHPRLEPIPRNTRMEQPMMVDKARRRHVHDGHEVHASPTTRAGMDTIPGAAGAPVEGQTTRREAAREARHGRDRFLANLAFTMAPATVFA